MITVSGTHTVCSTVHVLLLLENKWPCLYVQTLTFSNSQNTFVYNIFILLFCAASNETCIRLSSQLLVCISSLFSRDSEFLPIRSEDYEFPYYEGR